MGKKLLAGILGGLAFFAWSTVAHLFLGLGEVGLQEIPNEQAVVASMKANMPASGLFICPGWGLPPTATHAQKMAAMQDNAPKIKAGPIGLLVYNAGGAEPLSPKQMLTELGTNIIQILLAIFLLGQTRLTSFVERWRFVTVAGVLAAISTNISYWNWYGFPGNYTLAYICTVAMGFVVAGLVVAAMLKPPTSTNAARA